MTDIAAPVITRRAVLLGTAGLSCAAIGAGLGLRHALRPAVEGELVTPERAFEMAASGDALLIDIRRPDEWRRTGIGAGAHPLDMRRDDFTAALDALVEGDRARPVILICAGGVRSRWLSADLADAGFSRIIDVPEGMQGSRAGPGWLRRGLPVKSYLP